MKRAIAALPLALLLTACPEDRRGEADREQTRITDQLTAEANAQVGMPDIINFTERRLTKQIFELRDRPKLSTFTYIVDLNGNLHCLGNSIGFGVPYSVQYTNPEKIARNGANWGITLPQPDPNGLFMPGGLSATWVVVIDPDTGELAPTYVEPEIIVSQIQMPAKTPCPAMRAAEKAGTD